MNWVFLGLYSLTVVFRFWYFRQFVWRGPLKNGERYFLDVEVPDGWHQGPEGKKWWARFRASILLPHALEAIGFLAIAIWGRWVQLPVLALVAPVFVVSYTGVILWWRRSSGVDRRKPRRLAVEMTERRLGDYSFWQVEGLILLLVAASWTVLAVWGDAAIAWREAAIPTYVVLGLAVFKAGVVKRGWALPADRTEEYQRVQSIRRKQAVRTLDAFRWVMLLALIAYAAVHSAGVLLPVERVRWTAIAVSVAIWIWMMVSFARGERAVARAAAALPPAATPVNWGRGWAGFGLFLAGLALLLMWRW